MDTWRDSREVLNTSEGGYVMAAPLDRFPSDLVLSDHGRRHSQ